MYTTTRLLLFLVCGGLLGSCIKVELKDERTIPNVYEVALVTHTSPAGKTARPATAIPSATTTQPELSPTGSPTLTTAPSSTSTVALPSATPLSPTPSILGTVRYDTWCREGPGLVYSGVLLLNVGEAVTLLGTDPEASWLWVEPSAETLQCWAAALNISVPDPLPAVPVITPASPPSSVQFATTPTQRARSRPPKPPSGTTETPIPYPPPYPAP